MRRIIEKFKKWKEENPEENYQYDQIYDFMNELGRGDMLDFMNEVEELLDRIVKK